MDARADGRTCSLTQYLIPADVDQKTDNFEAQQRSPVLRQVNAIAKTGYALLFVVACHQVL